MPLSSALRFLVCGPVPWHLRESRPVDVCQLTIYGLNSGVFLSTLLHMPYPNRSVVWRSVQSVFTRLLTPLVLFFYPPGYVHLYVAIVSPSPTDGLSLFPPTGCESTTKAPCVAVYMFLHRVQPGPVPKYRFYCLSARDTVCPIRCDVEILMAPGGKPSCLTTLPAVRHCQSQCEPTDSQTHLQSDGGLRCS